MDKLDKRILDALEDEEREIMEKIGGEQSLPKRAFGLFKGNDGFLNGAVLLGHVIFAIGGVYSAWRFFGMTEVLDALRWGLPAAVLLLATVMTRITLIRTMQTNRVLKSVKDLEVKVALLAAKR